MKRHFQILIPLTLALFLGLGLTACAKKKVAAQVPPPPPPPPQPTATLTASPSTLQKGQSTELSWKTENAADVTLEGIGTVTANGSHQVTPADSTTYRLIAKGPGGTQEAEARVTVTIPPPPAPVPQVSEEDLFSKNIKDIYFDYDKYDVRPNEQNPLETDVQFLAQHPEIKLLISGHCDERGSEEYNLGLGSNRADTVKAALVKAGISADRIKTISYGKEKPFCTQDDEQCWAQNRRAHFVFQQ